MAEYNIPEDLRYSEEDEWARSDGAVVVVGITDYAQQQLGDVVFVDLPEIGTELTKGESFGVIESVKAVADLYAPVSGEVVQVNTELEEHPESVNEACYEEGWIVILSGVGNDELEALLDAGAYRKRVEERDE